MLRCFVVLLLFVQYPIPNGITDTLFSGEMFLVGSCSRVNLKVLVFSLLFLISSAALEVLTKPPYWVVFQSANCTESKLREKTEQWESREETFGESFHSETRPPPMGYYTLIGRCSGSAFSETSHHCSLIESGQTLKQSLRKKPWKGS